MTTHKADETNDDDALVTMVAYRMPFTEEHAKDWEGFHERIDARMREALEAMHAPLPEPDPTPRWRWLWSSEDVPVLVVVQGRRDSAGELRAYARHADERPDRWWELGRQVTYATATEAIEAHLPRCISNLDEAEGEAGEAQWRADEARRKVQKLMLMLQGADTER